MPLGGSQSGSVFQDTQDPNVAWFLPELFFLIDPRQSGFSFAATQSGVDSNGSPFFHATLTFGIHLTMPGDARAYRSQNPSKQMREIPLRAIALTLITTSSDPQTGELRTSTSPGRVTPGPVSDILTFSALLGDDVIVAYENLQNGGGAVNVSAWYVVGIPTGLSPPAPGWRPKQTSLAASSPLGTTYASPAYAADYTVSDEKTTRVLRSVSDLRPFQIQQSEFSEFTALGDVTAKYPSFSRLYIGSFSRTIVAVPARYGIQRSSSGTAAVCQALLDSSATEKDASKFEFTFVLGPVVSPIDLARLSLDLSATAAKDCSVVLPSQRDPNRPASLSTPFLSAVTYSGGEQPRTFSLAVEITDAGANSPAVANANLFIKQLTTAVEPFLVGQFGIKLDDYYAQPVDVVAVLNFSVTSGTDDVSYTIDPTSNAVGLVNNSPLDLALSRYATGQQINVVPFLAALPAKKNLVLSGVQPAVAPSLLVDRTIALESPLTKAATARYLAFDVQDVQAVQYELGVVAAGVSFAARAIASIKVQIALNDLPQISVPAFTLTPLDESGNEQILLPIQYALTTLTATVTFTVQPVSPQESATQFTLINDFIDQPVLMLGDANIRGFIAVDASSVHFADRGIASIKVQIIFPDVPQISVLAFTLTALQPSGNQEISVPVSYAGSSLLGTVSITGQPIDPHASQVLLTVTNDFFQKPVLVLSDASVPHFS
jgi:hypothetical protein